MSTPGKTSTPSARLQHWVGPLAISLRAATFGGYRFGFCKKPFLSATNQSTMVAMLRPARKRLALIKNPMKTAFQSPYLVAKRPNLAAAPPPPAVDMAHLKYTRIRVFSGPPWPVKGSLRARHISAYGRPPIFVGTCGGANSHSDRLSKRPHCRSYGCT